MATTNQKLGKIVLQPKQTIYGITKQYHISEADLRKLNPNLDQHMKIGDEVTCLLKISKICRSKCIQSKQKFSRKTMEKRQLQKIKTDGRNLWCKR